MNCGFITENELRYLTNVKYIIATGGALTRLPGRFDIIKQVLNHKNSLLLTPNKNSQILIDEFYIMASLGVLSKKHPKAALKLLKQSLGIR